MLTESFVSVIFKKTFAFAPSVLAFNPNNKFGECNASLPLAGDGGLTRYARWRNASTTATKAGEDWRRLG